MTTNNKNSFKPVLADIINNIGITYAIHYKDYPEYYTENNSDSIVFFTKNKLNTKTAFQTNYKNIRKTLDLFEQLKLSPWFYKCNTEYHEQLMNFNNTILNKFSITNQKPETSFVIHGYKPHEKEPIANMQTALSETAKEIKTARYGILPLTLYKIR